jgi:hypothetical protein
MSFRFPLAIPVRARRSFSVPPTNTTIGKKNEAVTNALGIHQLRCRKDKCPTLGRFFAQDTNVASLSTGVQI